jgi:hypothetical protein
MAASLLSAGLARPALSAEPGVSHQVEVYVAPCSDPPYDAARFVELVRVELAALHVDALATNTEAPAGAELGEGVIALTLPVCERVAREVDLRVVERQSGTRLERRVELSDIAFEARARALAIAAAELYRAALARSAARPTSPAPVAASPTPRPSSTPVPAAPAALVVPAASRTPAASVPAAGPVHDAEVSPQPAWTLEASFVGRAYPSEGSALLGGDLAASVPLARWLALRGGAELGFGEATLPFDDANPITSNVALGMALGHLELLARSRGPLFLELGPRVDLGYGWVERRLGEPAFRAAEWMSDLGFEAGVRAPLARRWLGFLTLYVGHSLGGVALEAAAGTPGATSAGLAGMLFEAAVGVGLRPPARL